MWYEIRRIMPQKVIHLNYGLPRKIKFYQIEKQKIKFILYSYRIKFSKSLKLGFALSEAFQVGTKKLTKPPGHLTHPPGSQNCRSDALDFPDGHLLKRIQRQGFSLPNQCVTGVKASKWACSYKCISMNGRANGLKRNKSTSRREKKKCRKGIRGLKPGQNRGPLLKAGPLAPAPAPRRHRGAQGGPRGPVRQVDGLPGPIGRDGRKDTRATPANLSFLLH